MQAAIPDLSCNPLVLDKPTTGKTKLDPTVASRLLDLLSSDDKFRALFKSDPMGALIEAGHVFPANQKSGGLGEVQFFPGLFCYLVGELASKEEIAATRDLIHSHLMSTTNHQVIFAFEAGKIESTLTLKTADAG
jgi:putative modified peptide